MNGGAFCPGSAAALPRTPVVATTVTEPVPPALAAGVGHADHPPPPEPVDSGLADDGWTINPASLRRERRRMSDEDWIMAGSTHASYQSYKREQAASFLASAIPQDLVDFMVSGTGGVERARRSLAALRRERAQQERHGRLLICCDVC